MSRFIDADELIELVRLQKQDALDGATITNMSIFKQKAADCKNFIELIQNAPTVDAVPVIHGEWKTRKSWDMYVCSDCSHAFLEAHNYCPDCGAKMDGKGK